MRRIIFVLVLAVVGVTATTSSSVTAAPIPSVTKIVFNDPELECYQFSPRQVSAPVGGAQKTLSVAVVLDRGVTAARGSALIEKAKQSYTPIGIELVTHSVTSVNFTGTSATGIINQARTMFGGGRPAGSDLVAILTNADISDNGLDFQGLANCIGGVESAATAFMVSEDTAVTLDIPDAGFGIGPVKFYADFPGKVVAHEIGHLMGAHHHYGSCAEGVPTDPIGEVSPCTLMGPSADFISYNFSVLNAAMVRGHADAYL